MATKIIHFDCNDIGASSHQTPFDEVSNEAARRVLQRCRKGSYKHIQVSDRFESDKVDSPDIWMVI